MTSQQENGTMEMRVVAKICVKCEKKMEQERESGKKVDVKEEYVNYRASLSMCLLEGNKMNKKYQSEKKLEDEKEEEKKMREFKLAMKEKKRSRVTKLG